MDRGANALVGAATANVRHRGDRHDAGPNGLAVEMDGAGPAQRDAATEFRAGECETVTEDPEQGRVGRNFNSPASAIHQEGIRGHTRPPHDEHETWWTGREGARSPAVLGDGLMGGWAYRNAIVRTDRWSPHVSRPAFSRAWSSSPHVVGSISSRSLTSWKV